MALSILNNIPSLVAQNQLSVTNTNLQNTLFQLSSGSKINSGSDDPAGLSIADGLQANISALTQSAQNVTDGVGMLQTADGALSQVTSLLNRAVTLATEAGNAGLTTGSNSQQAALQNEFTTITNEINQIGANTTYNNTQVFTAAPVTVFLSDGSNIDANNVGTTNTFAIQVSMSPLSASALGLGTYATGTLDLQNNPSSGNTAQIGSQTYTFVQAGNATLANQVAISGSGVAGTLNNLKEAVNNGPNGAGTVSGDYGVGTQANTSATITAVNGGSATLQALSAGTAGNNITLSALLTTAAGSSAANLSGGLQAVSATGALQLGSTLPNVLTQATGALTLNSQISAGTTATGTINLLANPSAGTNASGTFTLNGLPTNGDKFQVGSNTYTFVTSGNATNAGDIAIDAGNSISQTLTNMMDAITLNSGGSGTTYDPLQTTGVTAQISGNSLVVKSTTAGTAGNGATAFSQITADSNYAFTGTTGGNLSGGTQADTIAVGNSTYTFVANGQATAGSEVGLGTSLNQTLLNLAGAVNNGGNGSGAYYTNGGVAQANSLATMSVLGNIGTVSAIASGTFGNTGAGSVALTATFAGGASTGSLGNLSGGKLSGGTAGDTVAVGGTTYTFVASGQATTGTEVALGSNTNATLLNLQGAVNTGGNGSGSYYTNSGTAAANGAATIAVNSNVATVTAVASGTTGNNSVALSGTFSGGTATGAFSGLAAGKLSGGLNPDTVTVGSATYTFVASGNATSGNSVVAGGSVNQTLVNLAHAVNDDAAGSGTTFSSGGTNAAAAMTVNGTTATVTAVSPAYAGSLGNSVALSSTITGAVVGGNGTLANGANAKGATGTLTFNSNPNAGDTVNVAGTNYTFVASGNATAANQVAIVSLGTNSAAANLAATLTNLKEAVNTSGSGDANAGTSSFGVGTGQNTAAQITNAIGTATNSVTVTATLNPAQPTQVGNNLTLSANLSSGAGGVVGAGQLAGGTTAASLATPGSAQTALNSITGAIAIVASQRGTIGSGINQMNAALGVMNNTSQKLTSSLSGIQDADIGQVVANMSKYQVLEQTGIAALSQSNTNEQAVLKLLP